MSLPCLGVHWARRVAAADRPSLQALLAASVSQEPLPFNPAERPRLSLGGVIVFNEPGVLRLEFECPKLVAGAAVKPLTPGVLHCHR